MDREDLEREIVAARAERDEAEAVAQQALDHLQQVALHVGGSLLSIDPDRISAAAQDLALAAARLKCEETHVSRLRRLLM